MPKVKSAIIVFTLILLALHSEVAAFTSVKADSIGLETKDGKTYILHKVAPGETLYSLSRRYDSAVSGIIKSNPGVDSGIKIEQILRIPYEKRSVAPKGAISHVVASSETLYAISRKYDVRLSDIKKWNNLGGNALNVGQTLFIYPKGEGEQKDIPAGASVRSTEKGDIVHTVSSSETLYSISRKYKVTMADIKGWNNLDDISLSVGQKLIIKSSQKSVAVSDKPARKQKKEVTEVSDKKRDSQTGNSDYKEYKTSMEEIKRVNTSKPKPRTSNNTRSFNKVVELGFAEVIKTENESKKWLALHRTAPIGTILRVKNEMNNLWVFVRVVGVLPETSVNDKVLIKISQTAYDKLGAINDRFPVEISYVP